MAKPGITFDKAGDTHPEAGDVIGGKPRLSQNMHERRHQTFKHLVRADGRARNRRLGISDDVTNKVQNGNRYRTGVQFCPCNISGARIERELAAGPPPARRGNRLAFTDQPLHQQVSDNGRDCRGTEAERLGQIDARSLTPAPDFGQHPRHVAGTECSGVTFCKRRVQRIPPSTMKSCAVHAADASDARKSAIWATSHPQSSRLRHCCATIPSIEA